MRATTDQASHRWYNHQHEADAIVAVVAQIAARRNVPPAQPALAWLMSRPEITAPTIGACKPQHLEDAMAALSLRLNDDAIAALEKPYRPRAVAGTTF